MKCLFLLLVSFLVSCVSQKTIRNEYTTLPVRLESGRIAYAGMELINPAVEWSSGNMHYSVPFVRPWVVMRAFIKELPISLGKRLEFKLLDTNTVESFKNEVQLAQIKTYETTPLTIPVFDDTKISSENHRSMMDEDCLKFLNDQYHSDYYLVTIGSIASNRMPNYFSNKFELTPHFTVVIYDKNGNKVYMKNYCTSFTNIQESEQIVGTYYQYLNETIMSNSASIIEDLGFIKDFQESTNFNLFLMSLLK